MFIDLRERETSMWERSIDPLPPMHTPTGDQTHNFLVYRWQSHQLGHLARAWIVFLNSMQK